METTGPSDMSDDPGVLDPVVVDEGDRCFFDHPLDHVPGMLLVAGVLDLVRARDPRWTQAAGGRLRLSMTFDRMCELGRPVWLRGEPVAACDGPAWQLTAVQDGATVCRATVGTAAFTGPAGPAGRAQTAVPGSAQTVVPGAACGARAPADPALVHRLRPENVLVGGLVRTERAAVLVPPPHHRLAGAGVHTPAALIESSRQLATMLGHTAHGRDTQAQMLWLSLNADLPTGLPVAVPLELRWEFAPARGARSVFAFTVADAASGERHGWCEIGVHTLSRAGYLKRRAAT
ncbi:AfsA-related hotdog domain-containing protein [Kitasatospora sp. NPDC001539]|uniref:AfsA-related hotdog domain-containing protein n=1 Tax=Kitasatospora sp. NPDC001539 TaxID=3154384 RepID=UPI00332E4212